MRNDRLLYAPHLLTTPGCIGKGSTIAEEGSPLFADGDELAVPADAPIVAGQAAHRDAYSQTATTSKSGQKVTACP